MTIAAASLSYRREKVAISLPEQEKRHGNTVVKRSIVIGGHKTSVSLEDPFWGAMKEIAGLRGTTLSELVNQIDTNREQSNLSSAIRLFVLDHYMSRAPTPATKASASETARS